MDLLYHFTDFIVDDAGHAAISGAGRHLQTAVSQRSSMQAPPKQVQHIPSHHTLTSCFLMISVFTYPPTRRAQHLAWQHLKPRPTTVGRRSCPEDSVGRSPVVPPSVSGFWTNERCERCEHGSKLLAALGVAALDHVPLAVRRRDSC